jgi:hypothetical protein
VHWHIPHSLRSHVHCKQVRLLYKTNKYFHINKKTIQATTKAQAQFYILKSFSSFAQPQSKCLLLFSLNHTKNANKVFLHNSIAVFSLKPLKPWRDSMSTSPSRQGNTFYFVTGVRKFSGILIIELFLRYIVVLNF